MHFKQLVTWHSLLSLTHGASSEVQKWCNIIAITARKFPLLISAWAPICPSHSVAESVDGVRGCVPHSFSHSTFSYSSPAIWNTILGSQDLLFMFSKAYFKVFYSVFNTEHMGELWFNFFSNISILTFEIFYYD